MGCREIAHFGPLGRVSKHMPGWLSSNLSFLVAQMLLNSLREDSHVYTLLAGPFLPCLSYKLWGSRTSLTRNLYGNLGYKWLCLQLSQVTQEGGEEVAFTFRHKFFSAGEPGHVGAPCNLSWCPWPYVVSNGSRHPLISTQTQMCSCSAQWWGTPMLLLQLQYQQTSKSLLCPCHSLYSYAQPFSCWRVEPALQNGPVLFLYPPGWAYVLHSNGSTARCTGLHGSAGSQSVSQFWALCSLWAVIKSAQPVSCTSPCGDSCLQHPAE